jgi:hypothetical protein
VSFVIAVLLVLILLALLDRPRQPVHLIDSFDVPPPVPVPFPMDAEHPPTDFDD